MLCLTLFCLGSLKLFKVAKLVFLTLELLLLSNLFSKVKYLCIKIAYDIRSLYFAHKQGRCQPPQTEGDFNRPHLFWPSPFRATPIVLQGNVLWSAFCNQWFSIHVFFHHLIYIPVFLPTSLN